MKTTSFNTSALTIGFAPRSGTLFRRTLLALALAVTYGIGTVHAADNAAAPVAHSATMTAAVADAAITAKVKGKLMGDAALKKSDISVTTTNGVVTLNGTAANANAKSVAESTTNAIEGVRSVDNNLVVATSTRAEAKANKTVAKTERVVSDSWITTKVKSELLADNASKGLNMHVKTTHGVVVLSGNLGNQDAVDHVKNIAGKVKGVKSVDGSAIVVAGK